MPSTFADALFWIAVATCAVAQVALLQSFFFGASRPARGSAASFRATETLWAVAPALVLVGLAVATRAQMTAPPTLRFEVTAPVGETVVGPAAPARAPAPAAGTTR